MEKNFNISFKAAGLLIPHMGTNTFYAQTLTNELTRKAVFGSMLAVSYFEVIPVGEDTFKTEGIIIEYGNEVYLIDEGDGYITRLRNTDKIDFESYIISKFNYPGDNSKPARAGLVYDYLSEGFGLNTYEYLENPKWFSDQKASFLHIMKIRYLFSFPDFRFDEDIDPAQFEEWSRSQPEYFYFEANKEWYSEDKKVDLTLLENEIVTTQESDNVEAWEVDHILKGIKPTEPVITNENAENAQMYFGSNSEEFKKFAKDIPMMDASGSSEDTVRVYKEFDLAATEWDIDYVYSFRYGLGSYLMKLKTTVLGRVECLLMVLHGTQWENVQLNDLLLDIKSDCKKDKAALIETYKKEIMNFIDFFEVI